MLLVGRDVGLDRLPVLRRRLDDRHVADPGDRHVQRARDRRRRQREHVEVGAQPLQALLLHDPEALLLVDHQQPQALEADIPGEQAVGADRDVHGAGLEARQRPLLLFLGAEALRVQHGTTVTVAVGGCPIIVR